MPPELGLRPEPATRKGKRSETSRSQSAHTYLTSARLAKPHASPGMCREKACKRRHSLPPRTVSSISRHCKTRRLRGTGRARFRAHCSSTDECFRACGSSDRFPGPRSAPWGSWHAAAAPGPGRPAGRTLGHHARERAEGSACQGAAREWRTQGGNWDSGNSHAAQTHRRARLN